MLGYFFFFSAPGNFPQGIIVSVDSGMTLRNISLQLKNEDVIRSRTVFEALVILYGGDKRLVASDYLLDGRPSVFEIARRMVKGESHLAPIKVVIPEGFDNSQIANAFAVVLPDFNRDTFLAETKQGYLFPDTYFFFPKADGTDVIKLMSSNFNKKIAPFLPVISSEKKNENDVISMASIIEREATGGDKKIVSGILWKRLALGMALQVDAAPETYQVTGLPKVPICNPGLNSIQAALNPQVSPYLFYLYDKAGNIHYAKTFTEHKANRLKYL